MKGQSLKGDQGLGGNKMRDPGEGSQQSYRQEQDAACFEEIGKMIMTKQINVLKGKVKGCCNN